jgi:two-component system response regulator FixJ
MALNGRVYVIDDDPAMRDSLNFLLGAAGFAVTLFETPLAFLDSLETLEFGCIVSDVRMPGIDGIDLLRRVQAYNKALPVVIMTGHGDIPLAVEAMKLGAMDFLEKPFEDDRLIGMITDSLKQDHNCEKSEAVAVDLMEKLTSLTPRERQVLDGLIAGSPNKIMARDLAISPRTIEVYRANVMTKMKAGSVSELVRLAIRAGILKD